MALFGDKWKCIRCGKKNEPLGYAPVPNELGTRISEEICKDCWKEWQQKQMQLINHFGLDVTNPDAHQFLFDNMIKKLIMGRHPTKTSVKRLIPR